MSQKFTCGTFLYGVAKLGRGCEGCGEAGISQVGAILSDGGTGSRNEEDAANAEPGKIFQTFWKKYV